MIRRWILAVVALLLTSLAIPAIAQSVSGGASGPVKKYRVVMQVSGPDPRGWAQAVNNALLMQRNIGKANVDIEIVANGMGIGMLKYNSPEEKEVAAALDQGIKVVACGMTMKQLMLEKEDMLPNISYVKGGFVEIMDRQAEGWHYLRAD